ncbi:MAG TPA: M56 family metallopeptidase [Candidatus Sulfotelmatobacter sp.]|nr:M56 family metallopeptidase [Candidatus Sulfotelmatobacter sp.]
MNGCIDSLNRLGEIFSGFAWPMLWQSSLLMAVVFGFDWMLARRIRASIRYALWMVVLVKLLLPPALALPTGATWWLWRPHPVAESPVIKNYTVSFGDTIPNVVPPPTVPAALPPPELSSDAWVLLAAALTGMGWVSWLAFRWLRVAGMVRRAATAPAELNSLLDEARQLAGLRRRPQLKMIEDAQSPAVYGLFRPVILLPRTLANRLSSRQLRAVLLHEAVHLRRGDVWVNCAQTFLQIAYWWHPLLWLANARIRRVREEAVDDAVMLALRDGANAYAPTLLEVAKFAFRRPLASLGLVGILESRSALRQRVERLVDFRPPRKAGVTVLSLCGIFAFSAAALPMGQGPAAADDFTQPGVENSANEDQKTLTEIFRLLKPIPEKDLQQQLLQAGVNTPPTVVVYLNDGRMLAHGTADQLADIGRVVRKLNGVPSNKVHTSSSGNSTTISPIPKVSLSYQSMPLNEVLGDLTGLSRKLDPHKRGMRFIFQPQQPINSTTGLPDKDTGSSGFDNPSNILISVTRSSVPLTRVPDAICSAANHPLWYLIKGDTVVFSLKPQYEMRTFRVNPNVFYSNLKNNVPSDSPLNETTQRARNASALAAVFFSRLGVNLDPPKTVFFNDRLGDLFVYATPDDLDVIEKAVEVLNDDPPMLHIKTRFLKVPQKFLSSAATESSFPGLTNGAILPNAEFQRFLRQAELQEGSEEEGEPEVTTISGRQTQMRCTITQGIITNFTLEASADAIAGSIEPYGRFLDGSAFIPQTQQVETGLVFGVVPHLLSDGFTIHLKTIATHIDFMGYNTSHGLAPNITTNAAGTGFSPVFQVSEASLDKNIWDGQTLVLFPRYKVISDGKYQDQTSKIAELAKEKNGDKVEIVLTTVTLIDAVGNRLHSEEELPFAQTGVPQQSE